MITAARAALAVGLPGHAAQALGHDADSARLAREGRDSPGLVSWDGWGLGVRGSSGRDLGLLPDDGRLLGGSQLPRDPEPVGQDRDGSGDQCRPGRD
jgi:hypothetical protein